MLLSAADPQPDRSQLELLIILLSLLPSAYVGAFVHELGHALFGLCAGFRIASFGLGTGKPFWVRTWGSARVYLARSRPLQGITFAVPTALLPTRGAWLLSLSGGMVVQGLFGIAALALSAAMPWGWGRDVVQLCGLFNAFWALLNLVPLRVRLGPFVLRSDGAQMLQVLRRGGPGSSLRDVVHMMAGLRDLWLAVGDTLFLRLSLLSAAHYWLELGGTEPARQAWEQAEALPGEVVPSIWGYAAYTHARIAVRTGEDEAEAALARAEALFPDGLPAGPFLVALARAELLGARGDRAGEAARLAELADHPLALARPSLRASMLAERLTLQAGLPGADLEALEAGYRQVCRSYTSDARDIRFYQALARAATERGDHERAARAFSAAIGALRRLAEGWTDATSREALMEAQAPLLAEARAAFEQPGQSKEVEKLAELFLPAEEVRRRQDERDRRRNAGHHLVGRLLALAGLAVAAGVRLTAERGAWQGRPAVAAATALALYAAVTLAFSYGLQAGSRLLPRLGRGGGWFAWLLMGSGWVVAAAILATAYLRG